MQFEPVLKVRAEMHMVAYEEYLYVFSKGKSDPGTSLELWREIAGAMRKSGLRRVLLEDEVDLGIKVDLDALRFMKKVKGAGVPINSKFAVVCAKERFHMIDFIASMVRRIMPYYNAKVFLDLEEAKLWLLSEV